MKNIDSYQNGTRVTLHKIKALIDDADYVFIEYVRIQEDRDILDALIYGAIKKEFADAQEDISEIIINDTTKDDLKNDLAQYQKCEISVNLSVIEKPNVLQNPTFLFWAHNIKFVAYSLNKNKLDLFSLVSYDNKNLSGDMNLVSQLYNDSFYLLPNFIMP